MIYVFLADGFEEIEALTPVDILRRAALPVLTVGVTGKTVTGAHGIAVAADISMDEVELDKLQCIILPGGMPGAANLEASDRLQSLIRFAAENELLICAICAAPMILGSMGLLHGRTATCYPGYERYLTDATRGGKVCIDDNYITAQGPGVSLEFAYTIAAQLGVSPEQLKEEMQYG